MGFDGMKMAAAPECGSLGESAWAWLAWMDYAGSALPAPRAISRVVEWPSTVGTMRT